MPAGILAAGSGAPAAVAASDAELVQTAYRKLMTRQALSHREKRAIERHEKQKEERLRWNYYSSIPHKHWKQMSGRQSKVIREQAVRYGLPFDGPVVNLSALVRALHDFLSDNAAKLSRDETEDLLAGPASPALERFREERAILARYDRLEREKQLLPRDQVREALGRIASILRHAGDTLQRQFGVAAVEILYEALDEARREIDASFAAVGEETVKDDGLQPDEHHSEPESSAPDQPPADQGDSRRSDRPAAGDPASAPAA